MPGPVAFICAMPMELTPLKKKLSLVKSRTGSLVAHTGSLAGRPIVAIVTVADSEATVQPFVDALAVAIERHRASPRTVVPAAWLGAGLPEVAMTPRDAFFAPHETVPASAGVGRVAAELIAPYPPGIPAVVPGEVVSAAVLDALRGAVASGVRVSYAADPSLETVQVVTRR